MMLVVVPAAPRSARSGRNTTHPPARLLDTLSNFMMSNTPRVFVGATTFLVTGMTSDACLQIVSDAVGYES